MYQKTITMSNWNSSNISDQKGKTVLITGATSGLGKEASRVLVEKNANIIMAVRNTQKAEKVRNEIISKFPTATIDIRQVDLSSLESISTFSKGVLADYKKLDILINNAGIMMCPFSKTADGFEIQMGTNHFGHFALTGHLMPLLRNTADSRIVVTSSIAHKTGNIDFQDINWESRKYNTNRAYSDSKLANLYFAYQLIEKLKNDSTAPLVVSAHPGWTKTELDRHSGVAAFIGNIIAQKVDMGTLPTLRAATDIDVNPGDYFGPTKLFEMRGYPLKVQSNKLSHNIENAQKLWDISEELTGVKY